MKTHYVYELFNLVGTIEYVGETIDTKQRFRAHKCKNGKFHNRTDISMNIVKEFNSKKDAYIYQCQLQKDYGLETDSERWSKSMKGVNTWMKGRPSNNKGKVFSVETKQKMSQSASRRCNTNK